MPSPAPTGLQGAALSVLPWYPILAALGVGLLVGWLLGKGLRNRALVAFVFAGLAAFAGYAALFLVGGVFGIENHTR